MSNCQMKILEVNRNTSYPIIYKNHYATTMPKLTKYFLGCYIKDKLVGTITLGWGTRPLHTIQKLFPDLKTKDYLEIGKMCMLEEMPKNSESQMLSQMIKWVKNYLPNIKYIFTWSDGIMGKVGYVYQSANFLYGGYIWTDIYLNEKTKERIHPRKIGNFVKGARPTYEERKKLNLTSIKGKQFRYIYPITKKNRKKLKTSTITWDIDYPKEKDLLWKIKKSKEKNYIVKEDKPIVDATINNFKTQIINQIEMQYE